MEDYRAAAPPLRVVPAGPPEDPPRPHLQTPARGPAPAGPRRPGRDGVVAGLLALLGALAYIPTAPFYFRPDDDGLAIFDALLVQQGARPYVDFFVHDSPFIHYWNALLLALGGPDMLTLRYGLVPFKILLLPAIYLLARPVAGRPAAALAAGLVLMADSGVNFGMPHPGWYALALGLLGLLGLRAWLRGGHAGWLLAAGVALGLAVVVKQNLGLFLLAGSGLFLLEPAARAIPAGGIGFGRGPGDRGLWGLRAGAWVAVLAGLLFMLRDRLRPDVLLLLWLPVLALAGLSLWPGPPAVRDPAACGAALRRVGWLAGGAAAVVLPWLLILGAIAGFDQLLPGLVLVPSTLPQVMFFPYKGPPLEFWQVLGLVAGTPLLAWALLRVWPGRPGPVLLGTAAGALAGLVLVGGPAFVWQGGIFTWYYVPPALIWLGMLLRPAPAPAGGDEPASVSVDALYRRFLLYGAVFGMLQLYPLMDRVHGAWSYPFTLPLLALALDRGPAWIAVALPAAARTTPAVRRVLAGALLVLPLLWVWFIAGWRLSLWWDLPASLAAGRPIAAGWQPLALPHANLYAPAPAVAQFAGLVRLIGEKTRPGEPIYAFPNEQAFYVMTERPRGSIHSYLLPGVTSLAEQQATMADLERNGVRYVIFFVPAPGMESVRGGYGLLDPLADYLRAHYHTLAVFGEQPGYAVLEHN